MAQTHPGLWSLKYFLPGMLFPEIFIRLFPSCHLDLSLNLPSSASLLWPHRRYLFHSPVLFLCILCSTCHYLALFCWLICLLTIWELHGSPLRTGTFFALVTSVSSGLRAGMVEPVSWLCNACINLWCWQNAIATNMTPTGAHNFGCRWVGETLFSETEVTVRSLGQGERGGLGVSPPELLFSQGNAISDGNRKWALLRQRWGWFKERRVSVPTHWLVCFHANKDSKSSQFDWSQEYHPDWSKRSCSDGSVKTQMRI